MAKEQVAEGKAEARAELSPDELERVSGGADNVVRPCPFCGRELQWTAMAMEFMCFNKECPDYFYADRNN